MKTVLITVDLEPDLEPYSHGTTHGISEGVPPLLELLDEEAVRFDFMILGSVSRKFRALLRKIASAGHGIGCHGWDHGLLNAKRASDQVAELSRATDQIESDSGVAPRLFRAANFSISSVALGFLANKGYVVDSSVIPYRVLRTRWTRKAYDYRRVPLQPYYPSNEDFRRPGNLPILEVPVAFARERPGAPLGAGFLNTYGTSATLDRIRGYPGDIVVLLVHPWELVDLSEFAEDLPEGYAKGCSAELKPFRDLIRILTKEERLSSLEAVAMAWARGGRP